MNARLIRGLIAACSIALSQGIGAASIPPELAMPAPSIDDGVAELPRYDGGSPEVWLYSQPAAKQDDGLGQLPAYAHWRDPWVFAHPAQKLDSGLDAVGAPARLASRGRE
jgi:hypothetical protein